MLSLLSIAAGPWDPGLLFLWALFASLISYAALDLGGRVFAARGEARLAWQTWGAVSLGAAIGALRALSIAAWPALGVSLLGGFLFTAVLLTAVSRPKMTLGVLLAGGLSMGAAATVAGSGITMVGGTLAAVASMICLRLAFAFRQETVDRRWRKVASALVMAFCLTAATWTPIRPVSDLSRAAAIAMTGCLLMVITLLICRIGRLQEQTAFANELFHRVPEAVAMTTLDDRVIRISKGFTQVFGYSPVEAVGRRLCDLIVAAGAQDEYRVRAARVAQGQRVDAEGWARRRDGSHLPVTMTFARVPAPGGETQVCAVYRDNSRRKQAEIARRAIESRWRAIFDNSAVGISVTDNSGKFIATNLAYQKMVGYSDAELQEMTFLDLTHEDDRPRNTAFWNELREGDRQQFRMDKRYRRKDGRWIWVRNTVSTGPATGSMPAFGMSVVEDITEARQAEERLRQYEKVVESSEDMTVVVDRQYRHSIANQAFLDFRGLKREQVIGRLATDFIGAESFAVIEPKLRECFQGKVVKFEMKCPLSVHGERDLSVSYFPIEGPNGVDLVACILRDITEQKRSAEELQQSFGQLRALTAQLQSVREEERTRLARELHDELGQSLTAIRIDLASLNAVPERVRQREKIESLMRLVDQTIHSVRRISTELRPGILDDLGLVAAVEWAAEDFELRTGVRCQVSLPHTDLPIDPDRATALFRIVQETLTNVARHAGATQVRIRLSPENGHLPLEIQDNGRGVGVDRLSAATSLGILGMRERARLLGGEFSIDSDPGKGTTVRVSIPREDPQPAGVRA